MGLNIEIVYPGIIPAHKYGGTERVIWSLGKALVGMGHRVTYLAAEGSWCDFAAIRVVDPTRAVERQVSARADIVHFQSPLTQPVERPYLVTVHGHVGHTDCLDRNTVFVSRDHAMRYGSDSFVYNGLDWDDYGPVELDNLRAGYHFLGKAAWRVKNLRGAIGVVRHLAGQRLYVLGGSRLNFKMGFRFTVTPKVRFLGMVADEVKNRVLSRSMGLIFPVRWPEPFGLAIIESLYFGCPVFGTPYGSLPELVGAEVGFLTDSRQEMVRHIRQADYDRKLCHAYARDRFNARVMAQAYVERYERILNAEALNSEPPRAVGGQDWPLPWNP